MTRKQLADSILEKAFEQYADAVLKYCAVRLRYNKNACDDCVQNTFLVLYKRLLSGEEIVNQKAFLYKTAENICKQADADFVRRAKRTAEMAEADELPAPELPPPIIEELDYDLLRELLLQQLSEEEQQLYDMKYVKQISLKEIARLLGISPGAAAVRTSRLRSKVRGLAEITIHQYTKGG